jgi:SAM-dependent methyltransferase
LGSIPPDRWRYVAKRLLKDGILRIPGVAALDSQRHARNTGGMFDPDEASLLLAGHVKRLLAHGGKFDRLRAIEIGPGNSLAQAFILLLLGAERVTAVDVRHYATEENGDGVYGRVVEELEGWVASERFVSSIGVDEREQRSRELLPDGARFPKLGPELQYQITDGVTIPLADNSCHFAYSVSVLEHVGDVAATYREMARVLEPGSLMSHIIDLRDHHHTEPHDFLRYEDELWSRMQGRSAGSTNRLRASDHLSLLEKAGFEVLEVRQKDAALAPQKKDLASRFHSYEEADLKALTLIVVARLPAH